MRTKSAILMIVVSATALTGCRQSCTSIGAETGVSVDLGQRMSQDMKSVEVCAAGQCAPATPKSEHSLWATLDKISSTDPVQITIKVGGKTVLTTTVNPTRTQPNGPSCSPTAYQAKVSLPAT